MGEPGAMDSIERLSMALIFAGPVSLWVRAARLFGVKVVAAPAVDSSLLLRAEGDACAAVRRFALALVATVICLLVLLLAVLPLQATFVRPLIGEGFDLVANSALASGMSRSAAGSTASAVITLLILAFGLLNAALISAIPVYLFRSATLAAAPAVSVALAHRTQPIDPDRLNSYPRVAYAIERVLGGRAQRA
ncbi:MAG: hypothetical protein HGA39_09185 [Coriobacteriia bacterium]|nr:hypothetical protein [Coriobacteriia bacterium]